MKRVSIAIAALSLATSAHAADLGSDPFRSPEFKPVAFTGLYIGAELGGDIGSTSVDALDGLSVASKGAHGGLLMGYDSPISANWIVGLYASGDYNDIGSHFGEASIDQKWTAKLGGRVGRTFGGETLVYVPVAYTMDWQDMSVIDGSKFVSGVYSGVGVERSIANGWTLGLEAGAKWSGMNFSYDGVSTDANQVSMSAQVSLRKHF
jgi:hypothetical protein